MEYIILCGVFLLLIVVCILHLLENKRLDSLEQQFNRPDAAAQELAAMSARLETLTQMQTQALNEQLGVLRHQQADQALQTEQSWTICGVPSTRR